VVSSLQVFQLQSGMQFPPCDEVLHTPYISSFI
jgi:hypothetical protein